MGDATALIDAPWRSAHPADAQTWLRDVRAPWWIAGGWALDLHLGESDRPHGDLDVGIFRRDAAAVISVLPDWEIFAAQDGALRLIRPGVEPSADANSLWCRPSHASEWSLELLLDDRTDEHWVYRRRREISRPVATIIERSVDGLPYLAPEIQLLYKAKALRARDQHDFERVLPHLTSEATAWLKHAIEFAHPDHPWITMLAR
jgi:hypothetical protein